MCLSCFSGIICFRKNRHKSPKPANKQIKRNKKKRELPPAKIRTFVKTASFAPKGWFAEEPVASSKIKLYCLKKQPLSRLFFLFLSRTKNNPSTEKKCGALTAKRCTKRRDSFRHLNQYMKKSPLFGGDFVSVLFQPSARSSETLLIKSPISSGVLPLNGLAASSACRFSSATGSFLTI